MIKPERTLVVFKPDAIRRGYRGLDKKILKRFMRIEGLAVVADKSLLLGNSIPFLATDEQIDAHLPKDNDWFKNAGEKTLKLFREKLKNDAEDFAVNSFGALDAIEIGKKIREWNFKFYKSGPIRVLIIEGYDAIWQVRKLIGPTFPCDALPGTIRGDFSIDSPIISALEKRAVENLIHASSSKTDADREIKNWFPKLA